MSKFAKEVVFNKKTTEWKPSYDGRHQEPVALPIKFPLLLAQGTKGIAVTLTSVILPYNFCELLDASIKILKDLAEEMMRKEENYRLVLAEDAKKLDAEVEDFRKKVQNNVFSSAERAQSEQNRLAKKEQSLREKSDNYSNELAIEGNTNAQKVSEALDNYIKEYNKTHGYDLIITKASLLFANEAMNITAEVLEGLNAAYKPADEE